MFSVDLNTNVDFFPILFWLNI